MKPTVAKVPGHITADMYSLESDGQDWHPPFLSISVSWASIVVMRRA